MRTFGLIVEGVYDEAVLTELIRKCGSSDAEVISRVCGPKGSLMSRFPGFLEEFRYVKRGSHVDKALVVRDADGKAPETLMAAMETRIVRRTYPFPVRCLVIVQELETMTLQ
jgi:hypothetical protein